jgi:hypothetical protein
MPKNLTDADVWETNVVCPVDGDTRNAASMEVGLQDLANRALYLRNRVLPAGSVVYPGSLLGWREQSAQYTFEDATKAALNTGTTPGSPNIDLPFHRGARLEAITLNHHPPAGSFAALGQNQIIAVFEVPILSGSIALIDSVVDPAANAGAYDIRHSFTLTLASPFDMVETSRLVVRFEQDDSAVANHRIYGFTYTLSPTP